MNLPQEPVNKTRLRRVTLLLAGVLFLILMVYAVWDQTREKEIALVIGEPWEDMRQRSSAKIDPAIEGHVWFRGPRSDARLRFIDSQYGFVTPSARFFTINFEPDGSVDNLRLSPQIEPLLLDDALKVALGLQEQWRSNGWRQILVHELPPFADTPQWRAQLRDKKTSSDVYWNAGTKYQVGLSINRFQDNKRPTEERYRITLSLSKPWVE